MILFLILFVVPLIEIALFVLAGDVIGFWTTISLVLLSAVIGALALRAQGLGALRRAQNLRSVDDATIVLADGVFLAVAGLLLLTPGFMTDAIGLLLLIPPIRRLVARRIAAKAVVHFSSGRAPGGAQSSADAEQPPRPEPVDPTPRPPRNFGEKNPSTPWRKGVEDAEILSPDEDPPRRE